MTRLCSCVLACAVWAGVSPLGGADIYRVEASIPSGGLDLVGMGYAGDALLGPSSAALVSVTGAVTCAEGLTTAHPFAIQNDTPKATLTLKDAGLLGRVPVRVTGAAAATTYFDGATLAIDETTDPQILAASGTTVQFDNLTVSSKVKPATWRLPDAPDTTCYVRRDTRIGCDGGTGTVVVARTGLGRTNGSDLPGLGSRGQAKLYLGDVSAPGAGLSSGTLRVEGGTASAWETSFGSDHAPAPEPGAAAPNVLQMEGGMFITLNFHLRGPQPALIAFNGGCIASHGWSPFLTFQKNASGDLVLEGRNGRPIDVQFGKRASFVRWLEGAAGRLVFRGDSDVYLYGGDFDPAASYAEQCRQGAQYANRADGQGLLWQQTGDLRFRANVYASVSRAILASNDFLPHGPANGGVEVVAASPKLFWLDLNGTTQSCNSLFGGGLVTNSAATAATLNIGENGNACTFDVQVCAGSPLAVRKLGAGDLVVARAIPGSLAVEAGRAVVTDASGAVTVGTLALAPDAALVVRGGVFTPPTAFDLSASGTGALVLSEGGVLRVGGEAPATFDVSRLAGDAAAVLEKVGAGALTLTGTTSFNGTLRVCAGTLVCAAALPTLSAVDVADGATLEVADAVAVKTCRLTVRGVEGAVQATYAGTAADGVQALEGLAGKGTVTVMPATAVWTGAGGDDAATTVGNWQGLAWPPDVTSGQFTPVFAAAAADGGAMAVGEDFSFRGLVVNAGIAAFALRAASPSASLALGVGGLRFEGEAADPSARTLALNVPIAPLSGVRQTWDLPGSNMVLAVNGPLLRAGEGDGTLVTTGAGTVVFNTSNATYTGSVVISNRYAEASGPEPFGPSNAAGTAVLRVRQQKTATMLLANVRISKPVVQDGKGYDLRQAFKYAPNTTNVFFGSVTPSETFADAFDLPESSTVVFAGGYGSPQKPFYINWWAKGEVVVSNKPFYATSWEGPSCRLRLHCPGNVYDTMYSWTNDENPATYDPYAPARASVDFRCPWGFDLPGGKTYIGNCTWDLHGHDQRIGTFALRTGGVVQSLDGPATLYVNQVTPKSTYPYVNGKHPTVPYWFPASTGDLKGELSLYKTGAFELAFTNRVLSATGTVTVAEGPLTLCAGTRWPGATNIVVTGGTLRLTASDQLERTTDFRLGGGALHLDDGVVQRARYVWLDDAARPLAQGVYGPPDAADLPPARRTPRLAGGGRLLVMGDGRGLALIFR